MRAGPLQTEVDASSVGGELDRIGEEIPHHLLEAARVARDRPGRRIEHGFESDALRVRKTLDGLDRRLDDGDEVNRAHLEPKLAGYDPGYIQKVVDELGQELRVPLDHRQGAGGCRVVQPAGGEKPYPAEHGGQRRTQLVRDDGEEPVLGLVRVTEFAPRILEVMKNLFIGSHVAEDADRTDDVAVGVP